jgi:GT2 family glycosyltransferase/glycosyltransferase involved in cell wall biosynthesis
MRIPMFKAFRSRLTGVAQLVDENWYLQTNPDVAAANVPAAAHYMAAGWTEGRSPNAYFDGEWYLRQNPDVGASGINPLVHYFESGWREGRNPHPDFDTRFYLDSNPDVVASGINPLLHFLQSGRTKGRRPSGSAHMASLMEPAVAPIPESLPEVIIEPPAAPQPRSEQKQSGSAPAKVQRGKSKKPTQRTRNCFFDVTTALSDDEIASLVRERTTPSESAPKVTIVIPVYKNLRYTLRCLLSVVSSSDRTPYRIIVSDDQSPDNSGAWLQKSLSGIANIEVAINPENLGFLKSCNAAAQRVTTPYMFLLNNDTYVLDGWLDELVEVLDRHPKCGLTGSKLLYPDGRLQEAGGIVWKDASGANFGRNQDAWKPEFNYMRDVDYISAAAILTPTQVWKDLGGFSEEFAPAYYEDTDYAMKVRQKGMRVIFQPLSEVIHFEGVSSGTDITQGVKRYQAVNKETFQTKWAKQLEKAGDPADFSRRIVDRSPRGRILIYDAETPRPDKDSGSVTAFQYMKILTALGLRVTFVPQNLLWDNKYSRVLQRLGVEVIYTPYETSSRNFVLERAGDFDMVMLSRAPIGGELINEVRNRYPNLPIIFDTVDIHHLRMFRQYELEQDWSLWEAANKMKQVELNAIRKADVTLIVSKAEVNYLSNEIGPFPHVVLPLIYEPYTPRTPFAARKDIAFVGGFRHTPNVDAVEFLISEIWPLIRSKRIGAKLHIIGSNMPKAFSRFASEDILPVGYVENLEAYMENIRLSVAPLRYGAGVKGKVGNSLRMGVPVVGTPIATEGMGLKPDVHVKVGSTAEALASALIAVYGDEAQWTQLSTAGREHVMKAFGTTAARTSLKSVVNSLLS